jgi:uncharacterized repeat protein (TIGR01451 family)
MHLRKIKSLINIISLIFITTIIPLQVSAATCTVSLTMAQDKTTITSGDTITRTITVKNTGRTTCKDVAYSVFYSPNEQFVSASPSPRASNYYWSIGTLASGKQATTKLVTKHVATLTDAEVRTEACASANNAADSCVESVLSVQSTTTVPVVVTPVPTTPVATSTPTATTTPPVQNPTPIASGEEKGIWVWNFPSQMNSATGDQQLQQLASHGFNVIYVTIDDYLDIATLPEGTAKETAKKTYFANLARLVTKANSLGMAVDAEGGWKDWAIAANRWKGFTLIDAAKQYNAANPQAKLRGFQYDVEPYLLSNYETNKAQVLTEFVAFIDQSADRLVGSDLKFSMAIPHFYDSAQAWTPMVTYGGVTKHTFTHLLRIMQKTPGGTILLMSYRDYFEGAGGTREIAEVEIKEATAGQYATKVIVSQETGNVDPAYVTYYGSTKAVVSSALDTINTAFKSYSGYGGVAVHYMDSFLVMK